MSVKKSELNLVIGGIRRTRGLSRLFSVHDVSIIQLRQLPRTMDPISFGKPSPDYTYGAQEYVSLNNNFPL